jgi:hypothetical protein
MMFGTTTGMPENVWVAIIAAVPPTIAAIAALWQARRLARPLNDVNRAVNHRQPGQATLIETVDGIASTVGELQRAVILIEDKMQRHLAHHQIEQEERDQGLF